MKRRPQKGVRLFFFGFLYWGAFMFLSTLLGFLKIFKAGTFDHLLTGGLLAAAALMGYLFARNHKNAVFRDICFVGFFWVWLSVMFEYWFLTYLNNYDPDYVLRNNMLFSSWVQIILYIILLVSPVYFFKKQQGKDVVNL